MFPTETPMQAPTDDTDPFMDGTLTSPGPSFEQPLEMLVACHDKVRHFARLALRLAEHVAQNGADAEAGQAAASILRYFDHAAPLHHADEEADLFPALDALCDPAVSAALARLEAEHCDLGACWQAVRPWLVAIEHGRPSPAPAMLWRFGEDYPAHAEREEREVYPAACRLSTAQLAQIGRRMRARRGARE